MPAYSYPQSVAQLATAILKPAVKKSGLAACELLPHWQAILGHELASVSYPFGIHRPRHKGGKTTLVIKAEPAFALRLTYEWPDIRQRMMRILGHCPFDALDVKAARVKTKQTSKDLSVAESKFLAGQLSSVEGLDDIDNALLRLGAAIKGGRTIS